MDNCNIFTKNKIFYPYTKGDFEKYLKTQYSSNEYITADRFSILIDVIKKEKSISPLMKERLLEDFAITQLILNNNMTLLALLVYNNLLHPRNFVPALVRNTRHSINENIKIDNDKYPFIPFGEGFIDVLHVLKNGKFKNFVDLGCGWGDKLFAVAILSELLELSIANLSGIEIQSSFINFAKSFSRHNNYILSKTQINKIKIHLGNLAKTNFSAVFPEEKTLFYSYSPFKEPSNEFSTFMENILETLSKPGHKESVYVEVYPQFNQLKKKDLPKNIRVFRRCKYWCVFTQTGNVQNARKLFPN